MPVPEGYADFRRFWVPALGKTSMVVKVKACSDARVMLSIVSGSQTADHYEIRMGEMGNEKWAIYYNRTESKVQ